MANEEAREAALYTGPVTTTFLEWANPEHMHPSGLPYLTALNEYAQYRRGISEGIRQAREAVAKWDEDDGWGQAPPSLWKVLDALGGEDDR